MKFIKRVSLVLVSLLLVCGITITASVDVHAESLGKIEIIKQDKADGTRLEGAEFAIYDSRNLMVEYLVTDATGKAITEDLPIGEYRIQEVAAPSGYKHEPTSIPVTIVTNGQIVIQFEMNEKQE